MPARDRKQRPGRAMRAVVHDTRRDGGTIAVEAPKPRLRGGGLRGVALYGERLALRGDGPSTPLNIDRGRSRGAGSRRRGVSGRTAADLVCGEDEPPGRGGRHRVAAGYRSRAPPFLPPPRARACPASRCGRHSGTAVRTARAPPACASSLGPGLIVSRRHAARASDSAATSWRHGIAVTTVVAL